jgi:UDP-glucuronate decarboxylase
MGTTIATSPMNAADLIAADLTSICGSLANEFAAMAGKRLLITGGAGFLGYYLVQSVTHFNAASSANAAIDLVVVDSFARGKPKWLVELAERGAAQLVPHNIVEPLSKELGEFQFIVHAAGIASPTFYRRHPLETMDANISGLRHLLDAARHQADAGRPLEGFLFFSSSEIYGDPVASEIPTAETYRGNVSCTGPRACYDESKRYGETLCTVFARQYGVPTKMARPFNNYGPGLKISDRRVIPDFARDIFAGRDIVMLSDGAPTRTFCYISDAVTGYYKVLVCGQPGEAYNVGTERPEISMRELAELLAEIGREHFGYSGRVACGQSDEGDYLVDNPDRRCPNIDKARRELGYNPQVSLADGLKRSLIWYHAHQAAEDA